MKGALERTRAPPPKSSLKKGGWRTLKLKNEKIFDIDSTPLRIITDKITSHYSRFVCLFSEKKSVVERKQKIKKIITKSKTQ